MKRIAPGYYEETITVNLIPDVGTLVQQAIAEIEYRTDLSRLVLMPDKTEHELKRKVYRILSENAGRASGRMTLTDVLLRGPRFVLVELRGARLVYLEGDRPFTDQDFPGIVREARLLGKSYKLSYLFKLSSRLPRSR